MNEGLTPIFPIFNIIDNINGYEIRTFIRKQNESGIYYLIPFNRNFINYDKVLAIQQSILECYIILNLYKQPENTKNIHDQFINIKDENQEDEKVRVGKYYQQL